MPIPVNELPLHARTLDSGPDLTPSGWDAMFQEHNTWGALVEYTRDMPLNLDVDPEFDAWAEAEKFGLEEKYRVELAKSRNQEEFYWKKQRFEREQKNREVLEQLSTSEALGLGLLAGITDPVAWAFAPIPVMRAATIPKMFRNNAAYLAMNRAKQMGRGATIGFADLAVSEVVLQNLQIERTLEESIHNVGLGALFGGVLGSWARKPDVKKELSDVLRSVEDAPYGERAGSPYYKAVYYDEAPEGSINPMDAGPLPLEVEGSRVRTYIQGVPRKDQDDLYNQLDQGIIKPEEYEAKLATVVNKEYEVQGKLLTKPFRRLTPEQDVAHSDNWRIKMIGQRLMESSTLLATHLKGRATGFSLDTQIEMMVGRLMLGRIELMNNAYSEILKTSSKAKIALTHVASEIGLSKKMSFEDLSDELSIAYDNRGKHDNPVIAKLAADLHELDKQYEEMLVSAKVLDPENWAEGQRLEKLGDQLRDEEIENLKETERLYKDIEKRHASVEEGRIKYESIPKDFDEAEVKEYNKRLGNLRKNLKSIQKRIKNTDQKKRRVLKAKTKLIGTQERVNYDRAKADLDRVKSEKPEKELEKLQSLIREKEKAAKRVDWITNRLAQGRKHKDLHLGGFYAVNANTGYAIQITARDTFSGTGPYTIRRYNARTGSDKTWTVDTYVEATKAVHEVTSDPRHIRKWTRTKAAVKEEADFKRWTEEAEKLQKVIKKRIPWQWQKKADKWATDMAEAQQRVELTKPSKEQRMAWRKARATGTQEYRQHASPKQFAQLREREKVLKSQIKEMETKPDENVGRKAAYDKARKTAKANMNARVGTNMPQIRKLVDKTQRRKAKMDDIHARGEQWLDDMKEFRYDPTHGDPVGGGWYIPRIFKSDVVFRDKVAFIRRTTDDLIDQMDESRVNPDLTPEERAKSQKDWEKAQTTAGREDLEDDMEEVWSKITHHHTGHIAATLGGSSKFKAQRKLTVRNKALRGGDGEVSYLETGYLAVKRAHVRSMTPELIFKMNKFDYHEELRLANKEYDRMGRDPNLTTTQRKRLKNEQERLTGKLNDVYELLHGRLGHPKNPFGPLNRMRQAMMNWNVMRALGTMPVSALPDLANIITRVGFAPMSRQLAAVTDHSARIKSKEAARRLLLVSERIMASRVKEMTLTGNLTPGLSKLERTLDTSTQQFITVTGMNHWNQALKEFVIVSYSDEIMRTAARFAKNPQSMSRVKLAKFAAGGIDIDDWRDIAFYHKRYGENEGGLEIPNIDKWGDRPPEADMSFEQLGVISQDEKDALVKLIQRRGKNIQYKLMTVLKQEADTTIVTPSAGSLPLWMRHHVGGMVGQFKTFAFTAVNKTMIPTMQRIALGDPNAMAGITVQMALGAGAYGLKMKLQGKEPDLTWATLVRESITRSGTFGIFADINAIIEKLSRGRAGLQGIYRAAGIESPDLSRYYTRPILGDIFGPSVGTIEDMNRVIGSMFRGEVTRGDISAWRRLFPYQNLWYIRRQLTEAQERANDYFGAE